MHLIVLNVSGLILDIALKYNNSSSFLILRRHFCTVRVNTKTQVNHMFSAVSMAFS